jgi:hypothetical protein
VAEQCRETGEPGLRTCSMKVDCSSGTVSATHTVEVRYALQIFAS